MATSVLLAFTNPADGTSDEEFNEWYEGTHVPELKAALPSLVRVSRYRTAPFTIGDGAGQTPYRFLAVYELDGDSGAAAAALGEAVGSGKVSMSTVLDLQQNPPAMQWFDSD